MLCEFRKDTFSDGAINKLETLYVDPFEDPFEDEELDAKSALTLGSGLTF